jgi:hypothetical protein
MFILRLGDIPFKKIFGKEEEREERILSIKIS